MKHLIRRKSRSRIDVTYISTYGLWLLTNDHELFVSFIDFPRLRTASSSKLTHVAQLGTGILYWPDLAIEIPLNRVRRFPLVASKPPSTIRARRRTNTRPIAV